MPPGLLHHLQLPQLYMATFFTRGVETVSELRISLRRLDAFLALPEPPPPSHLAAGSAAAQVRRCLGIFFAEVRALPAADDAGCVTKLSAVARTALAHWQHLNAVTGDPH